MGQSAVRSEMDTRIYFRVRESRDVELVLVPGRSPSLEAHGPSMYSWYEITPTATQN